jgi:hypothetical protein
VKTLRKKPGPKSKPKLKGKKPDRFTPIWDLYRDGLTQGSIATFLSCREQFRLRYVFGWQSRSRANTTAFGSAFHDVLANVHYRSSKHGKTKPLSVDAAVAAYYKSMGDLPPAQSGDVKKMLAVIRVLVERYQEHWAKQHAKWEWVARELPFRVEHRVPQGWSSGNTRILIKSTEGPLVVPIRGVFDGVFRKTTDDKLRLLETKTKGRIDEDGLACQLPHDIQTQLYLYVMRQMYDEKPYGVIYDVIRNPQLRVGKNENIKKFLSRLGKDVDNRSDHYFKRWDVRMLANDTDKFVDRFLNKVVYQIVQWWESIKHDPNDPWHSIHHYVNPNAFNNFYGRVDTFNALTKGEYYDLERRKIPYPELEYHSKV